MNRKLTIAITVVLILVVVFSLFLAQLLLSNSQAQPREFYVGVMFAYGNETSQVKALVDKVKDYTNLFILGSVDLLSNESALNEACDYIYNANLNFIVQFRGLQIYNYTITDWIETAHQRYGDLFLGIYRYDEPGGNQVDNGPAQLINSTAYTPGMTYVDMARSYVGNLSVFPCYYLDYTPKMFTSDYALYWFDYQADYTTIFAEFVGNQSRERHIALCRGAAEAFDKDWGAVVTWKYDQAPYLESGEELYSDLALAYSAGAKYALVFSYPEVTDFGILAEEHFDALRRFWDTLHSNPASFGTNNPEVAYVVPADYGFGFRRPDDTIWGLFPPDEYSAKIFNDAQALTTTYGARLNIFYDEPQIATLLGNYTRVYYWNQTIP
ncbi:MAG: hypothetical protein M1540_03030 [Candidatus Bathyarchaeota archaeon]|nr:hypothetical protein [Candidatus Bathyarchaeota archaeon]